MEPFAAALSPVSAAELASGRDLDSNLNDGPSVTSAQSPGHCLHTTLAGLARVASLTQSASAGSLRLLPSDPPSPPHCKPLPLSPAHTPAHQQPLQNPEHPSPTTAKRLAQRSLTPLSPLHANSHGHSCTEAATAAAAAFAAAALAAVETITITVAGPTPSPDASLQAHSLPHPVAPHVRSPALPMTPTGGVTTAGATAPSGCACSGGTNHLLPPLPPPQQSAPIRQPPLLPPSHDTLSGPAAALPPPHREPPLCATPLALQPGGPLAKLPGTGPCVLYTDIPFLSRFLRVFGHVAVTNSDRTRIYELRAWPCFPSNNSVWVMDGDTPAAGSHSARASGSDAACSSVGVGVGVGSGILKPILFGRPSKCLPLNVPRELYADYDAALEAELAVWRTRMHLGPRSNCHTFICDALNNMHRRAGGTGEPYTTLKLGIAVFANAIPTRPRARRSIAAAVLHDTRKVWHSLVESLVGLHSQLQRSGRRQLNRVPAQSYVPLLGQWLAPVVRLYYGIAATPRADAGSGSGSGSGAGADDRWEGGRLCCGCGRSRRRRQSIDSECGADAEDDDRGTTSLGVGSGSGAGAGAAGAGVRPTNTGGAAGSAGSADGSGGEGDGRRSRGGGDDGDESGDDDGEPSSSSGSELESDSAKRRYAAAVERGFPATPTRAAAAGAAAGMR